MHPFRPGARPFARVLALATALLMPASIALAEPVAPAPVALDRSMLDGLSFEARRLLTTFGSPSDILYGTPRAAGNDGVAGLLIQFSDGSSGLCSGSLLHTRRDILTAAHCLTDATGRLTATSAQAVFFPAGTTGSFVVTSTSFRIPPQYDGSVISDYDVALLRLDGPVLHPGIATYRIWEDPSTVSSLANFVGFGGSGTGATGVTLPAGTRRQGFNLFDAFLGSGVLLSDFDSGLPANDAACVVFGLCQTGLDAFEVMLAGGDSGGPAFIDFGDSRFIAGVASFGLRIPGPDVDDVLNSSFGEFGGHTFVGYNAPWILANVVPEPATFALLGLGLVGLATTARRRRA